MKEAEAIFEKHWKKATGKELDETTKQHMQYAIDAINEALVSTVELPIDTTLRYSQGEWRFSAQYNVVTTSEKGRIEGSKNIADIKEKSNPSETISNGRLIAAAPKMFRLLVFLDWYVNHNTGKNNFEISKELKEILYPILIKS